MSFVEHKERSMPERDDAKFSELQIVQISWDEYDIIRLDDFIFAGALN